MKKINLIIFILCIPLVYSLYGGETWKHHFDKCEELKVNITSTDEIIEGEYTILNNCTKEGNNSYICDCDDNYDFNVSFKINAVNNYTFNFNHAYSEAIEEQIYGGGSSSSSKRTRTCISNWNCTEWSNCQPNNRAVRNCTDVNNCNKEKPSEERICYYVPSKEEIKEEVGEITPIEEPQEEVITEFPEEELKLNYGLIITLMIILVGLIIYLIIINRKKPIGEEK